MISFQPLTDEELSALEGAWENPFSDDSKAYINFKMREKLLTDLTHPIAPRLFATIREMKKQIEELKKPKWKKLPTSEDYHKEDCGLFEGVESECTCDEPERHYMGCPANMHWQGEFVRCICDELEVKYESIGTD